MKEMNIVPLKYTENKLLILDQTLLPNREVFLEMNTAEDVWEAIYHLKVRGAPAIGVAAAYGVYISLRNVDVASLREFKEEFYKVKKYLASSRPTAVNLFWALDRMEKVVESLEEGDSFTDNSQAIKGKLLEEAEKIRIEDEAACLAMGEYGLTLLKPEMGILTHCNAGTLATAKYGTCLSPLYLGHSKNYNFKVFADETRPLLQGARLTAWELNKARIDVTLICDNMASIVMKNGWIDAVVVGCDRMAANGDGANKIGTSGVAILAKEYNIPFYMYVPTSTIDIKTETGKDIEIELRKSEEIYKMWYEKEMAPKGIKTYNPAFDVTDNKFITAVITEKGVVYPPYNENLKKILAGD